MQTVTKIYTKDILIIGKAISVIWLVYLVNFFFKNLVIGSPKKHLCIFRPTNSIIDILGMSYRDLTIFIVMCVQLH